MINHKLKIFIIYTSLNAFQNQWKKWVVERKPKSAYTPQAMKNKTLEEYLDATEQAEYTHQHIPNNYTQPDTQ